VHESQYLVHQVAHRGQNKGSATSVTLGTAKLARIFRGGGRIMLPCQPSCVPRSYRGRGLARFLPAHISTKDPIYIFFTVHLHPFCRIVPKAVFRMSGFKDKAGIYASPRLLAIFVPQCKSCWKNVENFAQTKSYRTAPCQKTDAGFLIARASGLVAGLQ